MVTKCSTGLKFAVRSHYAVFHSTSLHIPSAEWGMLRPLCCSPLPRLKP